MSKPLHIAINAQFEANAGGTATVTAALIRALGRLDDGDETYTIIGRTDTRTWLDIDLGTNQRWVDVPISMPALRSFTRSALRPLLLKAQQLGRRFLNVSALPQQTPYSNGFYERLGCDLIHFPYQMFVITALPSIYHPWDLQHLHYPQFFTPEEIAAREVLLRTGCNLAQAVVVASEFVRDDVSTSYALPARKLFRIPPGPPLQTNGAQTGDPARVIQAYDLKLPFMLYPAHTWKHKNHQRLLEALALLRDQHKIRLNLVCTGGLTPYWQTLKQTINHLRLEDQVRFLGLIPAVDLSALYQLSAFVIYPSLFEGFGTPPLEAWNAGKALVSSCGSSLGEVVGDAGLVIDPLSVESIADAAAKMMVDAPLRDEYVRRGQERLHQFNWEYTARVFRALYRYVGGAPLSDEDRVLLNGAQG